MSDPVAAPSKHANETSYTNDEEFSKQLSNYDIFKGDSDAADR